MNTDLFDRATIFATEKHQGAERKGHGFPYIIHCMEAAEIVATITNDPHLLAAAILHDTVEDTDASLEEIRHLFGDQVADLVEWETTLPP
ncbi:MAG: HD domain-containing protein, partial [Eubacterium sp.]|nr:HD domain-containing protein [Eubacterium sp.]